LERWQAKRKLVSVSNPTTGALVAARGYHPQKNVSICMQNPAETFLIDICLKMCVNFQLCNLPTLSVAFCQLHAFLKD